MKASFSADETETHAAPHLPEGWRSEFLPDGALRLSEAPTGRMCRGCGLLFLDLAWNAAVWLQVQRPESALAAPGPWLWPVAGCAVAAGVLLAAWGLWLLLGREEWRLQPDLMIVTRTLCGRRWERRFAGACFRISTDPDGNHQLCVQPAAGSPLLLQQVTPGEAGRLQRFGVFLAARSRWPLWKDGHLIPVSGIEPPNGHAGAMNGGCRRSVSEES